MDIVSAIMDLESGNLDDAGILALFQDLVNTGMAWSLQGSYGRTATILLERGLITRPTAQPNVQQEEN